MISRYLQVIPISLREINEKSRKVTNLPARSCPETIMHDFIAIFILFRARPNRVIEIACFDAKLQ